MKQHKFSSRVEKANENDCGGCCFCTGRQRRCLWITGLTILLALAVLLSSLLINAAVSESPFVLQILDPQPVFLNDTLEEQRDRALLLGQAITFPTVSLNKTWTNETALQDLHLFLRQNYAPVFEADFIESTIVNEHSLLLRVEGEKVTGNPYLLCAHLDVVPAGPRDQWSYPPFHGDIIQEDGLSYVFGRGAIDDKQSVIGILEALKTLVEAGERPQRTFYVAFGHDEEVGGHKGAAQIAMVLKAVLIDRQEVLSFILDEGMFVMKGIFPGVDRPVAYVGVVEKGRNEWIDVINNSAVNNCTANFSN